MARTRQKAKQRQAKRREEERKAQAQGTTGQKPPSNPAEQAVVQRAEDLEIGDVLEESGGDAAEAEERLDEELSDEAIVPVEAPEPREAPAPRSATETRPKRDRKPKPDAPPRRERKPEPKRREARQRGRLINFMIQVWAELRRVQWPDRTQVTQATGVVIVFCLLAGLYLAWWDFIFAKLVKAIL
jgi:preprotein translocase SecE subunit